MVSARREGDTVIVFIPGWMSESEELRWVDEMVARLERSDERMYESKSMTLDPLDRAEPAEPAEPDAARAAVVGRTQGQ